MEQQATVDFVLTKPKSKPRPVSSRIVFAIAFVIFLLFSALIISFFVLGFMIATKGSSVTYVQDVINRSLFSFSDDFTLRHFAECFVDWKEQTQSNFSYGETLWNSVWRTVLSAGLTWFTTAVVTYMCVHYSNKFTRVIYIIGLF